MNAIADKYLGQLLAAETRIKHLETGIEAVVKIFTDQYGIVACEAVCDNMVRLARRALASQSDAAAVGSQTSGDEKHG